MSPLLPSLCITICTTVKNVFDISLVVELLIYRKECSPIYQNKNYSSICKSMVITSLTGFNIALTNVDARLKQRCINLLPTLCNVVSTLCNVFRRCFNVGHGRCINIVQRWKSDFGFCFIFNVGSTLFQLWSTTMKQRWSDVEILAGLAFSFKQKYFILGTFNFEQVAISRNFAS